MYRLKPNKDVVVSAGRLRHYCQLPNETSCDISADICNFSPYVKIFIYLFRVFSWNPWRCSGLQ